MKTNNKCYFCQGGPVVKKRITHISNIGNKFVEIMGIPCAVCQQCGEKYFQPSTIQRLQRLVKHKAKKYINLPVYSYA